jgi:hypothetical protein
MGVLFDVRRERFCQLIVSGLKPGEARQQAGCPKKWRIKDLLHTPPTSTRIEELMEGTAKRIQIDKKGFIEELREEWRLARAVSQHSAALKAAEMLGQELHGMFRKQLEIGRPGEFDGMSADQLKVYILEQLKEMGLNENDIPNIIDSNGAKEIPKLTENSSESNPVTTKPVEDVE